MYLSRMTAGMAAEAVINNEITARDMAGACLARCAALSERINAMVTVLQDSAMRQADAVDAGEKKAALPLAGVPLSVKDDFCVKDAPTSCGSAALKDFVPSYNAAAVVKLVEAGAVITGKSNLDNFSLGSSTAGSFAGPTANPWDTTKTAGDGGAAAAATGQCLLALGSDSGGSLRLGASYCGLFGLLPTAGLVSRYGLNSFAPSFARAGVIARSADDTLAALKVMAGYDPRDSATAVLKKGYSEKWDQAGPERPRCGWPADLLGMLDEETGSILADARKAYSDAGVEFVNIKVPHFREALQAYYVIAAAEAFSNLARFDGIRLGTPAEEDDLEEWYRKTRGAMFGTEGMRRSVIGAYLLTGENFERYYEKARKVRALVKAEFATALEQCQLLMLPVADVAGPLTRDNNDFLDNYSSDRFCAPVSLTGLPALVAPAGKRGSLPVGIQLVGRPFAEAMLVNVASRIVNKTGLPPEKQDA